MFLEKIQKQIGTFNRIEKIYSLIFVLSILSGIFYGLINQDYYKCCEETLSLQLGENNFTIFARNFLLSGVALITGGFSSFYFVFLAFAIGSSFLASSGEILAIFFVILFGSLELIGVFLFGLIGFFIFERKALKEKSNLKTKRIAIIATILLFVSAVIEYIIVK